MRCSLLNFLMQRYYTIEATTKFLERKFFSDRPKTMLIINVLHKSILSIFQHADFQTLTKTTIYPPSITS